MVTSSAAEEVVTPPSSSNAAIYGIGAAAVLGLGTLGILAANSGGDGGSGSGSMSNGESPIPPSTVPDISELAGIYSLIGPLLENLCNIPEYPSEIRNSSVPFSTQGNEGTWHSSGKVRGPINQSNGAYNGRGPTNGMDEVIEGLFRVGPPITLVGTISFLYNTGEYAACIVKYAATYTKISD